MDGRLFPWYPGLGQVSKANYPPPFHRGLLRVSDLGPMSILSHSAQEGHLVVGFWCPL